MHAEFADQLRLCICFFEKKRVDIVVPAIPIVWTILMSENPIIPSTIKQNSISIHSIIECPIVIVLHIYRYKMH